MTAWTGLGRPAATQSAGVLKRLAVRGAVLTLGAQGVRIVLQFGSQVALARLLLPRDFGLVAMIGPIISFVQIFNELGLTQATVQREEISHDELSALFWINIAISLVLTLALCAAAPLVALFYGDDRLTAITMCLAFLLLLSALSSQQIALMNRGMRFTPLAIIDISCLVAAVVVGIGAAWLGAGYWSLVIMQAANSLTITLLAWASSSWRPSWPRRSPGIGMLLRFGGHLTGFNIVGFIGGNLDSILIGRVRGAAQLGLFDRSIKLVIVPTWQVSLPIARVAVALLSRIRFSEDRYARAYLQMLQGLLMIMTPGLAWIAATSSLLVPALFGAAWTEAAPIVSWLAVATVLSPLSLSTYWLFVSQDRVKQQLRYGIVRTGFTVVALGAGLPWGGVGVAISYAVFGPLIHGSSVWGATREGPVRLPAILLASYPILLGSAAAAAAIVGAGNLPGIAAWPALLKLAASLGLAYATCAVVLAVLPHGRTILRTMWTLRHSLSGTLHETA